MILTCPYNAPVFSLKGKDQHLRKSTKFRPLLRIWTIILRGLPTSIALTILKSPFEQPASDTLPAPTLATTVASGASVSVVSAEVSVCGGITLSMPFRLRLFGIIELMHHIVEEQFERCDAFL